MSDTRFKLNVQIDAWEQKRIELELIECQIFDIILMFVYDDMSCHMSCHSLCLCQSLWMLQKKSGFRMKCPGDDHSKWSTFSNGFGVTSCFTWCTLLTIVPNDQLLCIPLGRAAMRGGVYARAHSWVSGVNCCQPFSQSHWACFAKGGVGGQTGAIPHRKTWGPLAALAVADFYLCVWFIEVLQWVGFVT